MAMSEPDRRGTHLPWFRGADLRFPKALLVAALALGLANAFFAIGAWADDRRAPPLPTDSLPPAAERVPILAGTVPLGLAALPEGIFDHPRTAARVALGRALFFDARLSRDHTVSCATCHRPENGFASPDRRAIGIRGRRGPRNSPTLFNRAYGTSMFWDGRTTTLEEQALEPIENGFELDFTIEGVIERLREDAELATSFDRAFPTEGGAREDVRDAITPEHLAAVLAAFQRTLLLGDSAVDRFHAGDYSALSDEARQGLWIFESRGNCWKCHAGSNFSDERFHNTGVAYRNDQPDMGRFMATGSAADENHFKTPTLRGLALTAPYMHDGSFATLREVVEYYNEGGNRRAPGLDERLEPLGLSEEQVGYLVAFLEALTPSAEPPTEAESRRAGSVPDEGR